MCKIVKNSQQDTIFNIISNERPLVKEYVNACYTKKKVKISPYIADIVSKYLEENVS